MRDTKNKPILVQYSEADFDLACFDVKSRSYYVWGIDSSSNHCVKNSFSRYWQESDSMGTQHFYEFISELIVGEIDEESTTGPKHKNFT